MKHSLIEQLAGDIVEDFIANGQIPAGGKLPSLRALAARYGVSSNSMAQAVGALAVQGLVEKRHGSGCYVRLPTTRAASRATRLLGLVLQAEDYELMMRVYQGVQKVAQRENYQLVVADGGWHYESERAEAHKLAAAGCQALIVYPATRTRRQLSQDYLNHELTSLPIVLIDMAYPSQLRPQVVFDNYHAGMRLTEYLLRAGHRRIAFMDVELPGEELVLRSHQDKRQGYLAALRAAGVESRAEDFWILNRWAMGAEEITRCLRQAMNQSEPPTAVIALEDRLAIQTSLGAQALGIRVPQQLRIVGADNLNVAAHFTPPILTTAQDFEQAGEMAAQLAFNAIRGEDSGRPTIYLLPAPLHHRTMGRDDQS